MAKAKKKKSKKAKKAKKLQAAKKKAAKKSAKKSARKAKKAAKSDLKRILKSVSNKPSSKVSKKAAAKISRQSSRPAKDIVQFAPNFTAYVLPDHVVCLYSEDRKFFLHGELYVLGRMGDAISARGRLVIRKSGTEPLIRVMAEGDDPALVERVVDDICEAVRAVA